MQINREILVDFETHLKEQLGISADLKNLWKLALYDHRAYKILPISSLLYGTSEHDHIMANAFVHILSSDEKYKEILEYIKSDFNWERQPNYFNYKYLNDTAGMLYNFIYYS